jgi:uncharacterized membrane protein (DUF485 family)
MGDDAQARIEKIERDPEFHALVRERSRFAWSLCGLVMILYFGFILLVAFAPEVLGQPIGLGVITVGIPLGIGIIIAAFAVTGLYVWRANGAFDAMTRTIVERTR